MRRLIFREGTSNKFWEVCTDGKKMIIRYGRIGTAGREESKTFQTSQLAESEMQKLIGQKLKKGYVDDGAGQATGKAPSELIATLAELEKCITSLLPAERAKLRPPATAAEIAKLSETFHSGKRLPQEIVEWFEWHNGQADDQDIVPDEGIRLLSIKESINAWKFFENPRNEFLEPWRRSWLPLMENGGGDYVVYETDGPKRGQLINYYHDDKSRPIESKGLLSWAKSACQKIKRAAKKTPASMPEVEPTRLKKLLWTSAEVSSTEELASDPVGTIYQSRRRANKFQPFLNYYLFFKTKPNQWIESCGSTFDYACDNLLDELKKRTPSITSDSTLLFQLKTRAQADKAKLFKSLAKAE